MVSESGTEALGIQTRTGYAVAMTESQVDWDPDQDDMPPGTRLQEVVADDATIDDAELLAQARNFVARRAGTKRHWAVVLTPGTIPSRP